MTNNKLLERFLSYVTMDTQSDPNSTSCPSTDKQWHLAKLLEITLKEIGLTEVSLDDNGYVMGTLPPNCKTEAPTIGFIAHYDTTPDYSGKGVKPQIHKDYDGGDIILNHEKGIILSPKQFPEMTQYVGHTLITTDGTTLLGADDKAGVAEIITAVEYLVNHPELPHGKIRVAFTPDEEIGRGAHRFDVKKFEAQWAYTIDGSGLGELQYENFNAARAKISFSGISVHPGYAKEKMVNSLLIAQEFISQLPEYEIPQKTSGTEGFFHVYEIKGSVEHSEVNLIIRDHDTSRFIERKQLVSSLLQALKNKHPKATIMKEIVDEYYNMSEIVKNQMHIVEIAERAMHCNGIKPIKKPIRGGTDGSQLSFMGLPCPNIFAGGHNFHGKYEYVPLESMEKAVQVIISLAQLVAKKQ